MKDEGGRMNTVHARKPRKVMMVMSVKEVAGTSANNTVKELARKIVARMVMQTQEAQS